MTAAYATLILIGSVIPVDARVSPGHLDKAAHLCEYLLFAWLLVQVARRSPAPERRYVLWAWLYATSYGLLMELIQMMVPWRSAEVMDALMNALGAGLGVWIGAGRERSLDSPTPRPWVWGRSPARPSIVPGRAGFRPTGGQEDTTGSARGAP